MKPKVHYRIHKSPPPVQSRASSIQSIPWFIFYETKQICTTFGCCCTWTFQSHSVIQKMAGTSHSALWRISAQRPAGASFCPQTQPFPLSECLRYWAGQALYPKELPIWTAPSVSMNSPSVSVDKFSFDFLLGNRQEFTSRTFL